MGNAFEGLIVWAFMNLPWLFIGLAAAVAWTRRKQSVPLVLQVLGALGLFTTKALLWLIFWLMGLMHVYYGVRIWVSYLFTFLFVVLLLLFMAGYIWEKYRQWREGPAEAAAFPVQAGNL
jgi:hypothetical protein